MTFIKLTKVKGDLPRLAFWECPSLLLASFGLTGYAPLASGTVASFAALIVYLLLPVAALGWLLPLLGVLLFVGGIPATSWMANRYEDEDPSQATVDEGAVMLLVLVGLPREWGFVLLAFALFRVFDIFKPPPCKAAERLPNGWGIMVDDLVAGVYAGIILWAIYLADLMPAWLRVGLPVIW